VGTLHVRHSALKNITILGDVIPRLIDEIPILALAGAVAQGTMIVKDARELRVKETDRLRAICTEFKKMGCDVTETEDGFILNGGQGLKVPDLGFTTYGDHRIAMTLAMAGLLLERATKLDAVDCIQTSFPEFTPLMTQVVQKNSQNS
jgi:3-phosphoshikimate 1-carboxyvinyltransferase